MHIHFSRLLAIGIVSTSLGGFCAPGFADPLALPRQTCTTLNCGGVVLGTARINAHPSTPKIANSWVQQFAAAASSCLRFQVLAETGDLTMTVVAPNGTVFTNDNGGVAACTACPRVVVAAATNGFYTATISNKGGAGVESAFSLRVGLYNSGNSPNCNAPTQGK